MTDPDRLLLPEGALLLHIGPYKTGSTSAQTALHNARQAMDAHGVCYPGTGARDRRAGWAVLGGVVPRGRDPVDIEEWWALVREADECRDQRVCISNEDFGRAGPLYARRIVDDLGQDRVHVLAVARRFDRLLRSSWQERVKNHSTIQYHEYLEQVLEGPGSAAPAARSFWASHNVEATVERWAPHVGKDRFALVVTDDSDRRLLLDTFEAMLGLPSGLLEFGDRSNPSFTMNGIELLRRINEPFEANGWSDRIYWRLIQSGFQSGLRRAPSSEHDLPIPQLPRWAAQRVAELSAERVQFIKDSGVRVVGDPDCLQVPASSAAPESTSTPDVISLDAAAAAVVGVVEGALEFYEQTQRRHERELRAARRRAARRTKQAPVVEPSGRELARALAGRIRARVRRGFRR